MSRIPNGYRRAVASVVAALSIAVLMTAAVAVLVLHRALGPPALLLVLVFLALHSTALVVLLGRSPVTDLEELLAVLGDRRAERPARREGSEGDGADPHP
jgi:hypothetical protein